jgi:hypothetical protein
MQSVKIPIAPLRYLRPPKYIKEIYKAIFKLLRRTMDFKIQQMIIHNMYHRLCLQTKIQKRAQEF